MDNFNVETEISCRKEILLVIQDKSEGNKKYRLIKDGVEFSVVKEKGDLGWEVQGTPLDAEQLDSIGKQIKETSQ